MVIPFLLAAAQGSELVETIAQDSSTIAKTWDNIWQTTILNPDTSSAYIGVVSGARNLAVFLLVVWFMYHLTHLVRGNNLTAVFVFLLVPVLIYWSAISNNGAVAATTSYSINRLIVGTVSGIQQLQVAGVKLEEAVKDMGLTNDEAKTLAARLRVCANMNSTMQKVGDADEAKYGKSESSSGADEAINKALALNEKTPQYMCFLELRNYVEGRLAYYQQKNCQGIGSTVKGSCNGAVNALQDIMSRLKKALQPKSAAEAAGDVGAAAAGTVLGGPVGGATAYAIGNVAEVLGDYASEATTTAFLYQIHRIYIKLLYSGLFLAGLIAPLAIVCSLLPFTPRAIWIWLIGFFNIGLAMLIYSVLIGVGATVFVKNDWQLTGASEYAWWIGFLAPATATVATGFSAWASVHSASRNMTMIGSSLVNVGFGVASTAVTMLPMLIRFIR
jgi:hypothetical protein